MQAMLSWVNAKPIMIVAVVLSLVLVATAATYMPWPSFIVVSVMLLTVALMAAGLAL